MTKGRPAFAGIPQSAVEFLAELGRNNAKPWFEEHKKEYRALVVEPLAGLVGALAPAMLEIDPLIETAPAVGKTLSRIHRDVRFSKDKSPYRTAVWIVFKRRIGDWKDRPCFFFEFTPEGRRHGMGFYSASRGTMDAFRRDVLNDPDAFRALAADMEGTGIFKVAGESYKRPQVKDAPDDLAVWLNRKSFCLMRTLPLDADLFSPDLADILLDDFRTAVPLYRFVWRAVATDGDGGT